MDEVELRQRLNSILDAEECSTPDWDSIEQLCSALSREIDGAVGFEPPHLVHHFLDDADIRQRDAAYGATQRAGIRQYVETGDRTSLESTPISPGWCLLVGGMVVGLIVWLTIQ